MTNGRWMPWGYEVSGPQKPWRLNISIVKPARRGGQYSLTVGRREAWSDCGSIREAVACKTDEWNKQCLHYRGRILTGEHGHYCPDWDELPIDETCQEWPCPCCVGDAARKEAANNQTAQPPPPVNGSAVPEGFKLAPGWRESPSGSFNCTSDGCMLQLPPGKQLTPALFDQVEGKEASCRRCAVEMGALVPVAVPADNCHICRDHRPCLSICSAQKYPGRPLSQAEKDLEPVAPPVARETSGKDSCAENINAPPAERVAQPAEPSAPVGSLLRPAVVVKPRWPPPTSCSSFCMGLPSCDWKETHCLGHCKEGDACPFRR
jgi:hypothetical protein